MNPIASALAFHLIYFTCLSGETQWRQQPRCEQGDKAKRVTRNGAAKHHRGLCPFSCAKGTAHYRAGLRLQFSQKGLTYLIQVIGFSRVSSWCLVVLMGVCLLGLASPRSGTMYIIHVHWDLWGQTLLSWRFPGDLVEHCSGVSVKMFQENSLWVTDLMTKICPKHRHMEALDRGPERRKAEDVHAHLFPVDCGRLGPWLLDSATESVYFLSPQDVSIRQSYRTCFSETCSKPGSWLP